jgi:hypothetical protein
MKRKKQNKKYGIFFLGVLFLCVAHSHSQVIIESDEEVEDIRISIDTSSSQNVNKSLFTAMGLSLLVPGGGEWYLQEKSRARAFFTAEALFWGGLLFSYLAQESYLQSSRSLASKYGGIDASGKGEGFLDVMTRYRSYQEIHHREDSYEQAQILSGVRDGNYDIPNISSNHWDFGSPLVEENTRNWNEFKQSFKSYGYAKVAVTWFIGGLVLGRALSALHTLHLYRTTSVRDIATANESFSFPNWQVTPWVGVQSSGLQLTVGW